MKHNLAAHKQTLKDGEKLPADLVSWLVKALAEDPSIEEHFTADIQASEIFHCCIGASGIADSATNLMFMMSQHQSILEKVQKEVASIGAKHSSPSRKQLDSLVYCDQVIREMLRYFPFVPGLLGYSLKAFDVGVLEIPAHTKVIASTYSTDHDSSVYANPHTFNPDRFAPGASEDSKAKCPLSAYIPQGGEHPEGHRCMGEMFTRYMLKLFLLRVCYDYRWDLIKGQDLTLNWNLFTPQVRDGLIVNFFAKEDVGL